MSLYEEYLNEIETRKKQGLSAKPIDDGDLAAEIIAHVKDANNKHHDCLLYTSPSPRDVEESRMPSSA